MTADKCAPETPEQVEKRVYKMVDAAPPLTKEQRARLALLWGTRP